MRVLLKGTRLKVVWKFLAYQVYLLHAFVESGLAGSGEMHFVDMKTVMLFSTLIFFLCAFVMYLL